MTSQAAASAKTETPYEQQRRLEKRAMPIWQMLALQNGVIRSCLNCEHWRGNSIDGTERIEECRLAPGSRPPATVIVLGCDSWDMDIPF